jgi:dihydrofolate reductase
MQIFNEIPVTIIGAMSNNGYIGMKGQLPWQYAGVRLKGELKRFKETTIGNGNNAVIYGRLTLESMPKIPLEERYNCVLSRSEEYTPPNGVEKFSDLASAIKACRAIEGMEDIFVIGGYHPFKEALEIADRMILTVTWDDFEGDVKFPEFDEDIWRMHDKLRDAENRYDVCDFYNLAIHPLRN